MLVCVQGASGAPRGVMRVPPSSELFVDLGIGCVFLVLIGNENLYEHVQGMEA